MEEIAIPIEEAANNLFFWTSRAKRFEIATDENDSPIYVSHNPRMNKWVIENVAGAIFADPNGIVWYDTKEDALKSAANLFGLTYTTAYDFTKAQAIVTQGDRTFSVLDFEPNRAVVRIGNSVESGRTSQDIVLTKESIYLLSDLLKQYVKQDLEATEGYLFETIRETSFEDGYTQFGEPFRAKDILDAVEKQKAAEGLVNNVKEFTKIDTERQLAEYKITNRNRYKGDVFTILRCED